MDVLLQRRTFLVGPNASGKSNFLDAFKFLRDIADPQGGFQRAVRSRRGVSPIRSLHAHRYPNVAIEVEVDLGESEGWTYRIEFGQDNQRKPILRKETVHCGRERLLKRPDPDDELDESRLTETHLEQVNANKHFRQLQDFFAKVRYLHLVPQLVREPDRSTSRERDPYGSDFLDQMASTPKKSLNSRLDRITKALQVAVPQLEQLELDRDDRGIPHIRGRYAHWRSQGAWQREDQLSDGTLRLLGLLWVLLEGSSPLLLEEPELSLHPAVIRHIPAMLARIGRRTGRQVLLSTHSVDLLSDEGISAGEVILLEPTQDDTRVIVAGSDEQVRALIEGGIPMGEAVLPRTAPRCVNQLSLFGDE